MKEYVWLCKKTSQLHVSVYDLGDLGLWFLLDPQAIIRAFETSEPKMQLDHEYEFLGEL